MSYNHIFYIYKGSWSEGYIIQDHRYIKYFLIIVWRLREGFVILRESIIIKYIYVIEKVASIPAQSNDMSEEEIKIYKERLVEFKKQLRVIKLNISLKDKVKNDIFSKNYRIF